MIGLPAPFYNRCTFYPLSLFFEGLCPQRSPGTEDDRPPLPRTVPPKATRPYRRKPVPRPRGSGLYVWINHPPVTDSSVLSTPAEANRGARIRDIRSYVTRKRQNPPIPLRQLSWRPALGRQAAVRSGRRPGTGYFVRGKITCV